MEEGSSPVVQASRNLGEFVEQPASISVQQAKPQRCDRAWVPVWLCQDTPDV